MKPLIRPPHPVAFTAAAMAVALVVLVLGSMSLGRGDTAAHTAKRSVAPGLLPVATTEDGSAIRPFRVSIPEAALADLRRRIAATRWPEQFAAWEEPDLFAAELRAAFTPLRTVR